MTSGQNAESSACGRRVLQIDYNLKLHNAREKQVERKRGQGVAYPDIFRIHIWQIYFPDVYIPVGWNANLKN